MQAINPIIAPLSSIQLKSGIIDSFHFNVGANDYHAFGEMEMYYKNLKIKLVKSSDSTKTGFLQHIAGFFINSFILKRNAQGRKGHLYFERLRDRSFFNYVVKIAFAGITTTTGAKRSKAARKKYEQVLKSKKFPELISIN